MSAEREALLRRIARLNDEIAEIDEKRAEIDEKRAAIKGQIEKAQAEVHMTGAYADPDWYRRAKGALRHLGVERADACSDLGDANRRLKELNMTHNRDLFRQAVVEVVDALTWERIVERHEALREGVGHEPR